MAMKKLVFCLLWALLFCFNAGGPLRLVNGDEQRTWCVAKPSSDDRTLKKNLNYACDNVDCNSLKQGSPCFLPNTYINHASVAMNLYYQANGRNPWNCDFENSALITTTDPSYGDCVYFYRKIPPSFKRT